MKKTTQAETAAYSILVIISVSHFLNDMIQSVVPAIYPILKEEFSLSFAEIGLITLVFQMASSLLQPFTGLYADRHPQPYSLSAGMGFTLAGLLALAFAGRFWLLLVAVSVIGLGSSIFHPEASRVAQMASGGRKSLAQSIFQVGGNGGSAVGPLLAAAVVLPYGQEAIAWFGLAAILASLIMLRVGAWYRQRLAVSVAGNASAKAAARIPRRRKRMALLILVLLVFSKYFYTACITSYFTFFLIDKFHVGVQTSQLCLFAFLAAFAIGTVAGGMFGDRFGRKYVIWFSILGAAPFALALPFCGSLWLTVVMAFMSGLVIASAFSSIVVYATDLVPDKVGLVAGVFFGLMFGLGGLGSAFFGWLADRTSVELIFQVSAFLPLLGIVAGLLPDMKSGQP